MYNLFIAVKSFDRAIKEAIKTNQVSDLSRIAREAINKHDKYREVLDLRYSQLLNNLSGYLLEDKMLLLDIDLTLIDYKMVDLFIDGWLQCYCKEYFSSEYGRYKIKNIPNEKSEDLYNIKLYLKVNK